MRRITSSLIVLAMIAAFSPAIMSQAGEDSQLGTFAFAIGNGMLAGGPQTVADRLDGFDLIVVDGAEASSPEVAALRAGGATVLAYLSVGTIERWRGWFQHVKRFRLGAWRDWEDEWFADVSKPALRRILVKRVAPDMLAKGFDGLFLDNVDMIEPRRFAGQREGMRKLVARLARLTASTEGGLFAQNGFWGMRRFGILPHLDGWNREDVTWTWDFDRRRYVRNPNRDIRRALSELEEVRGRGLLTMATNYTKRSTGRAVSESVDDACSVGALPYVGDIGLTAKRLPDPAAMACK